MRAASATIVTSVIRIQEHIAWAIPVQVTTVA